MEIEWKKIEKTDLKSNQMSRSFLKDRPCPVCLSDSRRPILGFSDFQLFSDDPHVLKQISVQQVQCRECLCLYMNPTFTSEGFEILFSEAGYSYASTEDRTEFQKDWLARHGLLEPGMTILDVGCYEGKFLSKLPSNVHRSGVDIDPPAIQRAKKERPELELVCGDLNSFRCSRSPDTITMFHVLEHLVDPASTLRHLRNLGHDHTKLLIEVPILEKSKTSDLVGFFSVQHLTHFSKASLRNLLSASGWRIVLDEEAEDYNGYRVLVEPASSGLNGTNQIKNTNDLSALYSYFTNWYSEMNSAERKLQHFLENRKWILWGAGVHTEILFHLTSLFSEKSREFVLVDGNSSRHGRSWRGIKIYSPQILAKMNWNSTCLLLSSYGSQESMKSGALEMGVPKEKIICLYDVITAY